MSDSPRISPGATDAREPSGWAPESLFDGRFQVVRELGRGGMGAVFIVFDRETCRELALKRIYPDGVGKPHLEERFRREFRALAAIQSPGVPKLFHTGRSPDGVPWFLDRRHHGHGDGPDPARCLGLDRDGRGRDPHRR